MTPSLPPVSLVLCTRNRPGLVRETIESILAADAVPDEIVVIDQSDVPDRSLEQLTANATTVIRVVASDPNGLGQARNEGIAAARHDVLVFVDDDMLAHPGWLDALVGGLVSAQPRAVVTGAVEATAAESWRGFTPSTQAGVPGTEFAGRIDRDVLAGGHMASERSALEAVGGFDPRLGAGARFPAADDNDLGFRLLEAGYRIVYIADAVLYHRAWRAGWQYPLVRWRYGLGKGGFYAKHRAASDRHIAHRALRDITHRLRRFPRLVLRQPTRAAGDIFYIAGIVSGGTRWVIAERRQQKSVG
jgi:glycosyltransferase involved in cell wall biosynthesis